MSDNFFNILSRLQLGALPLTNNNADGINSKAIELQGLLQQYAPTNHIENILTNQTQQAAIMAQETKYLGERDDAIRKDIATGERMMQLNDSNRKKYFQYVTIVMIWVGAITVVLLLIYLKRVFSDFPFNLFFMLTILAALLWSAFILYTISKRDPTDFDKLYLIPPDFKSIPVAMSSKDSTASDQWDMNGNCIGESCCTAEETYIKPGHSYKGTTYEHGKCLPGAGLIETFQNRGQEGFKNKGLMGFKNRGQEGFTAIGDLLASFPPNLGANLFPFYSYNYACEGDDYCVYRDQDNNFI